MAKDPAFLFYPNDYIGGTMGMTFEEKGAYIDLLMMQFNRGHMSIHMITQVIGHVLWESLKHKFVMDASGCWYNERLEIEKNKRISYANSRKNNLKGKNQYTKTEGSRIGHMPEHMENEIENVNVSVIGKSLTAVEKSKRYSAISDGLKNDEPWLISVAEYIQEPVGSVMKYLEEFLAFLKANSTYTRDITEIRNHFTNWLKKQVQSNTKPDSGETSKYPVI
jgi:uncharacterized protein YdaU (DUF1376 family)